MAFRWNFRSTRDRRLPRRRRHLGKIRTSEIALLASSLSQDPRVRAHLTGMQRQIGENGGIVAEGRDTGSVVFPDADVKFYLDADIAERARRRHAELAAAARR